MLVHTNLNKSTRLNRVSYANFSESISLNVHTQYFSSKFKNIIEIYHQYHNTTCQIICDPLIKSESFCHCVDAPERSREYMCDLYDAEYKLCVGFKCKNGKCLLNNVRCNGINDCGDRSDESNCEGIYIHK
ncbi:hypothetical protein RF11_10459 [Thelohanellus kitauei]|uniref:Uncharacterized protein n=1 Tax=Thelohanellus kitauei TaxID=669202 RepID=A0A0C2JBD0_THEKT|nr:hypothetical protein RF11_10459 [Thelohanellus kitauei]